ncbi:hypothetical protein RIF29_01912 [Crotalaria pallida]|uniref:Uncharacterized protein n=1 Tax=Crotalaria pallida TaxID=3830 RepID=A0AAN9P7L9_CROPI
MEAVSSTRLGRASSRYGAPTVFSGPVRKWKKKWVHVPPPTVSSASHNTNSSSSSRLLLRRWTPIAAASSADDDSHNSSPNASDEPPRRKFRYTPIAVLEDQKNVVTEKAEFEPTTESDQLTAQQTNVTRCMHGELNMNEVLEDTKGSNMDELDLGLGLQR